MCARPSLALEVLTNVFTLVLLPLCEGIEDIRPIRNDILVSRRTSFQNDSPKSKVRHAMRQIKEIFFKVATKALKRRFVKIIICAWLLLIY